MDVTIAKVDEIIGRYGKTEESILAVLQDFQREFRYVPEEGMKRLAGVLDVPESRIYAMGTFYKALSLEPRGKHTVKVCMGTACHLKGANQILEAIERGFSVKRNHTTKDKNFTVESVNCVGACAMAPVIVVDEDYHGHARSSKVVDILKKYN
ncbi:MAG TPA: NAD(P)H-dependent oxidoreductase subunit E [Spirochaetota bacterium]|nr:NAD(P)H-dependent oxidoreductase subunit E [Spirochaetota bacterium]HNT11084.1 NAD(P)H-dependent oxidoreductase subunit E [Spirochaetota bacterium]HNV48987.1 NAD(P)H-dependent oxidoreductase subunit E [Spirochaetota bacterium]HOS39765.1 NAD(P)H-dependent oxidoreductase subunit E [Spirochaetota bacterium]HPU90048.1 NAD(P)H-dependent oxidoreductase subunit E [Spirochaetota bacterium]